MEEAVEKATEAMLGLLPTMVVGAMILSALIAIVGVISHRSGSEEEEEREVALGETRSPELEDEIQSIKDQQKRKLRFRFKK